MKTKSRTSGVREQRRHGHLPIHSLAGVPLGIATLAVRRRREELCIHPLLDIVIIGDFG